MSNRRFVLWLVIWMTAGYAGYGQLAGFNQERPYAQVSIASPTAASLGKYADIPVSYHTGIPKIEIPIYTVKEGPLELPISLSYHAAGLKVMEPAGWVGAGWTLNAGGVITRTVRGAPDERNTSNAFRGHFSDYGFGSYLTENGGSGYPESTGPSPNDNNFLYGIYDGEPDLFFFNFCGHTGKFYFNDDRTPVLVPGEDLKIDYYYTMDTAHSYTTMSANIQGFIITTPDGTKYYFGINASGGQTGAPPIEWTFPYSATHVNLTDNVYSSWYLNKIVSADGMFTINLSYQSESYSYYVLSMFPLDATVISGDFEYAPVMNNIFGVRLNQITFSNGSVTFNPTTAARIDLSRPTWNDFTDSVNISAKALDNISITDGSGFCKKFMFSYSYFQDNTSPITGYFSSYNIQSDTKRLKLDSVTEQSCDGSARINPYKFSYNGSFLPRRLSFAQDHWGFYNGATSNSSLIPTYSVDTFKFMNGANRDAKWPEMASGALTKITYPMGGYDSLEFEANTTHVSATVYNPVYLRNFYVGYDGSTVSDVPFTFSGNHYEVIVSNGTTPGGTTASFSITGVTVPISVGAGQTDTSVFVLPAGNYTVHMTRTTTQTGTGAQAMLYEVISTNVQSDTIVGGLRIKKIIRNDGISPQNNIVTTYSYNANGQSTGILYNRPTYVQVVRNDILSQAGFAGTQGPVNPQVHGCLGPEVNNNLQKYYKSPCDIMPMSTSQGNHIGYNEVKVTRAGNGYSIYRYYGSNLWDLNHDDVAYRNVTPHICSSGIPNLPAPPPPFEYKRGMLKYEGHFNEAGQVLKDMQYYYVFDSSKVKTPGYIVSNVVGYMLATRYELTSYWQKQTRIIETDYSTEDNAIQNDTTTDFASAFHHQPTRITTIDSRGDTLLSKITYPQDYRISNCDTLSDGYQTYTAACSACDATMNATIQANLTRMDYQFMARMDDFVCRAQARKNYASYRKTAFTSPASTFNTCQLNALNNAGTELKPILELQRTGRYPPIEQSDWRNSKLKGASFTRFDYVTNPSYIVFPNKVQLVNLSSTSDVFTPSSTSTSNTTVVKDSRYSDESQFSFNAGNPVQMTKHDGISRSYIWDYKNTQPIASVINATADQIAYTSFEADGNGGWTIGSTSRDATGAVTGKQSYNLANGACSRPGLSSSNAYVVSYWSKTGSTFTVTGSTAVTKGKTINGWTYFEHKVTGTTSVSITGSGGIDELRLYPATAQMTTYTYIPLVGIVSECDMDNRITYYSYDALGRLIYTKDQDGNITKTLEYHYKH